MAQTLFMNRRGTEPYARWCERTGEATPLPTRLWIIICPTPHAPRPTPHAPRPTPHILFSSYCVSKNNFLEYLLGGTMPLILFGYVS
jgi:hypothetical protein